MHTRVTLTFLFLFVLSQIALVKFKPRDGAAGAGNAGFASLQTASSGAAKMGGLRLSGRYIAGSNPDRPECESKTNQNKNIIW